MKTIYINPTRYIATALLLGIILLGTCASTVAQQHVIADKDNTRPEINNTVSYQAFISSFSALKWNGYNEIRWTAVRELDTRRYIIEYSTNGIDFQSAGEMPVNNTAIYLLKHYIREDRPLFYRVRVEQLNGRFNYSDAFLLEGQLIPPVSFYPTIITGSTINLNAGFPVQKMVVVSSSGVQVFTKDLNGQQGHIPVVIPSLSKGIYFISFHGAGWKTTEKFIIP